MATADPAIRCGVFFRRLAAPLGSSADISCSWFAEATADPVDVPVVRYSVIVRKLAAPLGSSAEISDGWPTVPTADPIDVPVRAFTGRDVVFRGLAVPPVHQAAQLRAVSRLRVPTDPVGVPIRPPPARLDRRTAARAQETGVRLPPQSTRLDR
ncbi:hypothetical protein [Amycolatopsis sp. GA6-003]|uniref:hypothetical protein n=1 Tax=Amycolatopsis sp. GA6-003 TaxID=2652444 RepID=UPI0039172C65